MLNDAQARAILAPFDPNPVHPQAMQAIAKALSNYGFPGVAGVGYEDNNWYDVPGSALVFDINGNPVPATCVAGSVQFPLVTGGFVCHRFYYTPQDGIQSALATVWFPPQADGTGGPAVVRFAQAVEAGDTATIAQMVVERAWGISRRSVSFAELGGNAATFLANDIFAAAQEIAAHLGEPLYLNPPPPVVPVVTTGFTLPTELLASFPVPAGMPVPVPPAPSPGGNQTNPGVGAGSLPQAAGTSPVVKAIGIVGLLYGGKKLYDALK